MEIILTLLTAALWFFIGIATAALAKRKGRDANFWFVIGIFFGLLAYLCLWLLPAIKKAPAPLLREKTSLNPPTQKVRTVEDDKWFMVDSDSKTHGPISFLELRNAWQSHQITLNSLVWTEGFKSWKTIEQLPYLREVMSDKC